MKFPCITVALFGLLIAGAPRAFADDGCLKPEACCFGSCTTCCPVTCRLYNKLEPIEKECYEIECKLICIPPVTFPWESHGNSCCCGTPRCGKVITVKTLKKHTYECGCKCVCEWRIEPFCLSGCMKPECCDDVAGYATVNSPTVEPVPVPAAEARNSSPSNSPVLRPVHDGSEPEFFDQP